MAHGRNKYQSREDRARVREILRRDWDPEMPEAADEYDAYADRAYVMLMDERATAEAIATYLFEIAPSHMELSDFADLADRSDRVGKTLVGLRLSWRPTDRSRRFHCVEH